MNRELVQNQASLARVQLFSLPEIFHMIFVFGSNLAGAHGAGAAYEAFKRGFPYHLGVGYSCNCYAIPTKDCDIQTLPIHVVQRYVTQFRAYAAMRHNEKFQVTRIGCGLAGFKDEDIAPMFAAAPQNCYFDEKWKPWLDAIHPTNYWGTYE